ncbi:MAG TPA: type 2 lanthipeptide synthetase LanM family protein, partial [Ktedonobacteraceae bacterium]|nr:type 2 lanthipeptide synthetase LanM family protein [Ktedonobacteraceae bacterium]
AVEHWVTYGLEFFQHLQEDWPRLRALLEMKAEPGLLTEARCGMGDQHRRGRSTILVSFSSGLRLVYKPRSLSIDQHFQLLLAWINQQGWQPRLRVLRLLDCGEHGWSEFVEALPCRSQAEVERFYLRQGAYLALLYTLNAVDFHYENLIAAGEDPMLIDLESLLHPQIGEKREKNAQTRLLEQMESSVLRVGMLPIRLWAGENSDGIDLSGLGGEGGQIVPRPVLQPINPGTDEMRFVRKNGEMPAQQNRPHLEGSHVDFLAYRPQLLQGFREMYRLLMQRKDALLAGPLQLFAEDSTRIIIRPTNTYAVLLHEGTHPNLLRNMLDRDSFFDQLWLSIGARPELKRVIAAEQADLHSGDIPIFTSRPATRDIFTSRGERIPDFCAAPALEQVTSCLDGLNELDLERQLWFIEATLASARLQQQNQAQATRSSLGEPARTDVTPEDLLHEARLIGDRLAALAFRDGQRAQWLALTMVNDRTWEIQPAGPNLYGGVAGIALFLAYLGVMSGDERYRQLAEEAVRTLQSQIEGNPEAFKDVGAFSGWGGIIYLYTHLGVLWQDQNWFKRAEEAIQRSVSLLQEDTMLDIMAGAAGYIMALLALDQVWPSPLALKTARQAGDYLVTALQQAREGEKPSFGLAATRPLTGLSHGSAGLALSLMSLAARENHARYRAAAQEVLAYERSVYVPERQNWPDFRILDTALSAAKEQRATDADGQEFMTTWCHGAAGIGLARLASLPYQDDEITRAEIAVAVQTTLRDGFGWCHSLCHGDLGNLDLLLVARARLAEVCEHTRLPHLLARILAGIEQSGYITGAPMGLEVPGLMVGLAGMGYAFLRASDPTRVPSVLILEPPVRQPFQKPVEQSGG